jgi:hypothetical protein
MFQWGDRYKLSSNQAKSVDGKDLGNVQDVENNYVLIEGESKFYIPTYLIEKYDGNALWFKIDEDVAKSKFMIATSPRARI